MTTARLTRVVRFSAAHRYYRPDWTPERNRDAFGACTNDPGHGHSYQCFVTITGPLSTDRSMILDLEILDTLLREEIVDRLDHQHINHVIPEFAYGKQIPTCEALAVYLWERVAARLPDPVRLHCIRLQEDPYLYAEYYGDRIEDASGDAPV